MEKLIQTSKIFQGKSGSLPYVQFEPKEIIPGKKYPLIIFFHGAGERGNDNKSQLAHGIIPLAQYADDNDLAFLIAPQCPSNQMWVDIPWTTENMVQPQKVSATMMLAIDLLQTTIENYPIDLGRIYVSGISMGGFGVWDIILRLKDTFAAALPICGGGDARKAENIKSLPIWTFHGDKDSVVNTTLTRDMVAALKQIGSKVKYTEYPDIDHNSWSQTYENQEVLNWLFSQKLN